MAFLRPYPPTIWNSKNKIRGRFHNGKQFYCELVTQDYNAAIQFRDQITNVGACSFRLKKNMRATSGTKQIWYFVYVCRGIESTFSPESQDSVTN